MTANACPCGGTTFTEFAERCEHPGCDSFGDHIDDDGTEWCQWHCPGAECVAERMPKRIQLRRTKGWRKPEGAIVVARPSQWGNPFTIAGALESEFAADEAAARALCVEAFQSVLKLGTGSQWWHEGSADRFRWIDTHWSEIRGHDLACWCPLDQPCHADVLLELANA